jgi:hypothetical protein
MKKKLTAVAWLVLCNESRRSELEAESQNTATRRLSRSDWGWIASRNDYLFLIFLKEDEKYIVAHCQNTYAHARVAAKTGIDHTYR